MPNTAHVEIAAIYNVIEETSAAICGNDVRVRLREVDDEDICPVFVLTSPRSPVHAVRQFEAQLAILEQKKNCLCQIFSCYACAYFVQKKVTLPVRPNFVISCLKRRDDMWYSGPATLL